MLAVNYSKVRDNFKSYCDRIIDEDETLIVTRKSERNVVILSLEHYNKLTYDLEKALYWKEIAERVLDAKSGIGLTEHELIEVDDEVLE